MPKKQTTQEFKDKGNIAHNNFYNYDKSIYTTAKEELIITCPIHGDFKQQPYVHTGGKSGCKDCAAERRAKKRTIPFDQTIKECIKKHKGYYTYNNIIEYTTRDKKCDITCPVHGDFPQTLGEHISGKGCPKCGYIRGGKKGRLLKSEVMSRIFKAHGERYTYPEFDYINDKQEIEIICKSHGLFTQIIGNHMKGHGCKDCARVNPSKGEIEMREFLQKYVELNYSNRNILDKKAELDIYIPEIKTAIEFNGIYFHSDKFQDYDYHLNKTLQCQEKGIKLIHIFDDEWVNKKDKVKSLLLEAIGETENIISVEDCEVREVNQDEYKTFLEINYLEDFVEAENIFGLYYNNELVSLISENNKELLFCNKLNTIVEGGFELLLKSFSGEYTTTVDLRWSYGEREKSLGFKLIEQTPPAYFFTKGQVRTKKEKKGFNKIYDCGTLKLSNLL